MKNAEKSLIELANVIKNKSFLKIQNPELKEVIFDYGSFGDLTTNKSLGGNGIIHIIQRRAEIDQLSRKDISSLLLKIKDISENEKITGYDKTGTRAFINKDGIRVLLQKNWNKNLDNWLVTGYGIMDSDGKLSLEATETIKTVNAQYGYKPEHSLLCEQVGAVIASIDNIRREQLKVKQLKTSTKTIKGTKRISSTNPHNVYDKAVLKSNPKNCSDKELLTSLTAAIYAENALKNANNSELYKRTHNKGILKSAGNHELINKVTKELQARGYTFTFESTLNETNVHFQHTVFLDISNGKEKKIEPFVNRINDNPGADYLKKSRESFFDSQVLENPITEYGSSPANNIKQQTFNVNEKSKDWEQKYDSLSSEKMTIRDFEGSKISLNYDGKTIQGKIMLSDGDSVEIEPFEISESELNDCWYGFSYKGKDFDMNVCLDDAENEGTPVCIYPVINGTTVTTLDFAAIKKDSVFF